MAKESWSARIESSLKKEIQEFIKNSDNTNEDLVNVGYNIIKNPQEDTMQTNNIKTNINKKLFTKDSFNIKNFEEIDISKLNRQERQDKLIWLHFYKPYDTLLLMQSDRHFYVKSVDTKFSNITFEILEEETEFIQPIQDIINRVEEIKKIYQIKRG